MSDISRLRWLCRRGMKELDVVLSRYLELNYGLASPGDQQIFRTLQSNSTLVDDNLALAISVRDFTGPLV